MTAAPGVKPTAGQIRQAAYARLRNVSRQAIGDLVKRGVLALRDGKLDIAEADAACLAHLNIAKSPVAAAIEAAAPSGAPVEAPPNGMTASTDAATADSGSDAGPESTKQKFNFNDARAEREHYEALIAKANYLEQQGTLVQAADVQAEILEIAREVREQLMNVSPRISSILAAESDERKVDALLTKEMRQICEGLATKLANRRGGTA